MKENAPLSQQQIETLRAEEKKRLADFPTAPDGLCKTRPNGVLLSEEIKFYIDNYKLVDPPKQANIMAASYELRVGKKFAIGNKVFPLSEGEVLKFPKFEVVVVEILETINLPDFLIGRWNIRTRWAYEGLIWVGGPQVNPGFRGKIMCPLWNLSDKEISIPYGESIAVIDFSTTTPPTADSNRLPLWDHRTRYIFEDYLKDLRSGLVSLVAEGVENLQKKTAESLEAQRGRMDTFTSVTFSALGILVAAVAIIATKPSGEGGAPQYWWDPTVFWLCSITAILTLFAFLRPSIAEKETKTAKTNRWVIGFVALLTFGSMGLIALHQRNHERGRQAEIDSLRHQIKDLDQKSAALGQKMEDMQKTKLPTPKH